MAWMRHYAFATTELTDPDLSISLVEQNYMLDLC